MAHEIQQASGLQDLQPGDLLRTDEAASLLGIASKTLSNWRNAGTGPRWLRVSPRAIRYRRQDLVAFLEAANDGQRGAA